MTQITRPAQMIEILPYGTPWPAAGCAESVLLDISEPALESGLAVTLHRGIEDGLGDWAAIGLRLPSGAIVELINYRQRPGDSAFIVRTLATDPVEAVLNELLDCLSLPPTAISWRSGVA